MVDRNVARDVDGAGTLLLLLGTKAGRWTIDTSAMHDETRVSVS